MLALILSCTWMLMVIQSCFEEEHMEQTAMKVIDAIAEYCTKMVEVGKCFADGCDGCPMNTAYMMAFSDIPCEENDDELPF